MRRAALSTRTAWRPSTTGKLPRRHISTSSPARPRYLLPFLFTCAIGGSAYGLYSWLSNARTFPPSLRNRLRLALRSERSEDFRTAEQAYREAYDEARQDPSRLGDEPWLKVSGIGIKLAGMLEAEGRLGTALQAYSETLSDLKADYPALSGRERMRAIAVAQKIGQLAPKAGSVGVGEMAETMAEEALTWSVEELLRMTTTVAQRREAVEKVDREGGGISMAELALPDWVDVADVGASLEALGDLYARRGNTEYAMPLYLQSLSILLPPPPRKVQPSTGARCHAAVIMNNLAQLLTLRSPPDPNTPTAPTTEQAVSWAERALAVASTAEKAAPSTSEEVGECKLVRVVARQNLGMLAELSGDVGAARRHFEQAKVDSEALGMRAGIVEAKKGLRRLGS